MAWDIGAFESINMGGIIVAETGGIALETFGAQSVTNNVPSSLASVPWVAQWKFNNNGNDSIGANNLTNNNAATFTTGLLGGAAGATQLVAASNQFWSIATNVNVSIGAGDWSLAAWVWFDTFSASVNYGLVCKEPNDFSVGEYDLMFRPGEAGIQFDVLNTSGSMYKAISSLQPTVSTWYFIECRVNSTTSQIGIAINGGAFTETAYAGAIRSNITALFVGSQTGVSRFHDGRIDNVCIAKSATGGGAVLTAAQRAALYNGGTGTETIT